MTDFNPETVFYEVLKDEGVLLELTTHPAHTASFTWGMVNIPLSDAKKGRDFFEAQSRHEVGHRVVPYAPSTIERGMAAKEVARLEGIEDIPSFLNIVYDLMVDGRNLLEHPKVYRLYMEYYTRQYLESPDSRMKLLGNMGDILLGRKSNSTTANQLYNLLFRDSRNFYTRLRQIAKILKSLFTSKNKDKYGGYGGSGSPLENNPSGDSPSGKKPTLTDMTNPVELPNIESINLAEIDLTELARELQEADIEGERKTRLYEVQQYLKLMDRYVEVTESRGSRPNASEEVEIWRVGDDPARLDLVDTIQRYSVVIPGVTTLKKGRGSLSGSGGSGSVMLILDNSMSTIVTHVDKRKEAKRIIDTIREAAFCITETARRNGDEIGAIGFSTNIKWCVPMTFTEYHSVINQIIKMEPRGSTNLQGPASWALTQINYKPHAVTTFLITDGELEDLNVAIPLLDEIGNKGKLVVFLITGRDKEGNLPAIPQSLVDRGFTVYVIEAGQGFSEEALEEIVV